MFYSQRIFVIPALFIAQIFIASTEGFAEVSASSLIGDESSVFTACQGNGLPLWDCECVLMEFRTKRAADKTTNWNNIVAHIYGESCFDPKSIESFYSERDCGKKNQIKAAMKRPQMDCGCYGREMARLIVQTKPERHSAIGKLAIKAASAYEVR